jgi:hypothetical protein
MGTIFLRGVNVYIFIIEVNHVSFFHYFKKKHKNKIVPSLLLTNQHTHN